MALETELGVDSIKRVEILSDVQKELNVEAQDVAALARTQTVGEVVEAMIKELGGAAPAGGGAAAARAPVAAPAAPASGGVSAAEATRVVLADVAALARTQTVGEVVEAMIKELG
eukprot:scaffold17535_cov90-Phaeocystis_antarctica.AAC.1